MSAPQPEADLPATEQVRDLQIGNRRVRVSVRPGAGVPLLLCNGIGASLDLLQPFVDQVDPSIPVVRFDVPGVGGSELPRLPYRLSTLSCLLGKVLDELGFEEVDVLGISWGGGLAQQFALQHPRRCRRLVLVATATGSLMVPASPGVLSKMITPRRYRDPAWAGQVAATLYGGTMRDDPARAREILDGHSPVITGWGYVYQLLAGAGWTSLPFLPLVRQRTLVLAGNDDPIIPLVNAKILSRLLPHATLRVYDDGHLGLVTIADELGPLISQFLRAA